MAETVKVQSPAPDEQKGDEPAWEGGQYEAALAHLERLQCQIDNMRSTIPSIISPLFQPSSTKAVMFIDLKKAAVQATDDLKRFRQTWKDENAQSYFRRATESLEKDSNLEVAKTLPRYGWLDEEEDSKGRRRP
nr:hypothetical protein CFP56_21554 [Quercus suber]